MMGPTARTAIAIWAESAGIWTPNACELVCSVVMFVEIWPEAKKRQYKQALDAYEAAVGRQARVGSSTAANASAAEDV